ncbi:MAG: DUF5724 domain-containing protein [Firmicutes bacterium]|nr:DUF5724 domain-containing protein [Bacillota bacterium]
MVNPEEMNNQNKQKASVITGLKIYKRNNPADIFNIREELKTKPPLPQRKRMKVLTPAVMEFLKSLDSYVEEHKNLPVKGRDDEIIPLEKGIIELARIFPEPIDEDILNRLPLRHLWEKWWNERSGGTKDEDGLELIKAIVYPRINNSLNPDFDKNSPYYELGNTEIINTLLTWLLYLFYPEGSFEFILDCLEDQLSYIKPEECLSDYNPNEKEYFERYSDDIRTKWMKEYSIICLIELYIRVFPGFLTTERTGRCWNLLKWLDEPEFERNGTKLSPLDFVSESDKEFKALKRIPPNISIAVNAFSAGYANETDFVDNLITDRNGCFGYKHASGDNPCFYLSAGSFKDCIGGYHCNLDRTTDRFFIKEWKNNQKVMGVLNSVRDKIVETELARGKNISPASAFASELEISGGIDTLVKCLTKLENRSFTKRKLKNTYSVDEVLTHLIVTSLPSDNDCYETFREKIGSGDFTEDRLIDLALFAPQWAEYIGKYLNLDQFREAVFWIHSHSYSEFDARCLAMELSFVWDKELNDAGLIEYRTDKMLIDRESFYRIHEKTGPGLWQKLIEICKKKEDKRYMFAVAILEKLFNGTAEAEIPFR